ncbi:MAG: glycerol kinase GlpK [Verrucomicrobiota bacterium]
MKYALSLDQGTTSSRAILFNKEGEMIAAGQREFTQHFPRPGWVEHDAEEIWESQWASILEAFDKAGCGWESVACIGITNQRETVVAWDRDSGEPACPAIVWQDRRTADFCEALKKAEKESLVTEKTGLLLDPYFSGTKMRWMLKNLELVRALSDAGKLALGTVDSWLIWKLSQGLSHITDVSNASRTLLMDLRRCEWDEEMLDLFEVPRSALPEIVDSSGELAKAIIGEGGLEIPISGIAGEQQAALFGQLCLEKGTVKNTYGTGSFILMNVGEEPAVSKNKLLSTVAWRIDGRTTFALEGSVFVAGSAVQWLRDGLEFFQNASEVEDLARSVEDSGGIVIVPAFTGLGAPYWDPYARGAVLGITRGTSKGHFARATLEAIAMQSADVIAAMRDDSEQSLTSIHADGGAAANDLLMELQADFSGVRVSRPQVLETTALGAGYLAGLAIGYWENFEELKGLWSLDREFVPSLDEESRKEKRALWKGSVEFVRGW